MNIKQYTVIVRDHSYSMNSLREGARKDYNSQVEAMRAASNTHGIEVILSVIKCGVGRKAENRNEARVERDFVNVSIHNVEAIGAGGYVTDGVSTPLFDSVGEAITILSGAPDAASSAFLVQVITDGAENSSSKYWRDNLPKKIMELQGTDRWTFTFRVPRGHARNLTNIGIPPGNILEWDQTIDGIKAAADVNLSAMTSYYDGVATGKLSARNFYTANLSQVAIEDVKAAMADITNEIAIYTVESSDVRSGNKGAVIEEFCEKKVPGGFVRGRAFYSLSKKEKVVQGNKILVIVDRNDGKAYSGVGARQMVGLPMFGNASVAPGMLGRYDLFIQSTSNNRLLPAGTKVLVWRNPRIIST